MNTSASEPVVLAEIERTQRERLTAVVLLTERMLTLGKAGDWDQVSDSERCRQSLLEDCFETEVQPQNSEIFSEAIAAMLHMNEELLAHLQHARKEASITFSGERRGHQAVAHYLEASSV